MRYTIDAPARKDDAVGGLLGVANLVPEDHAATFHGVNYLSILCGHSRRYVEGEEKVFDQLPVVTGDPVTIYRGIETSLLTQSGIGAPEVQRAFTASATFGVEEYVQEVLNDMAVDITPIPGTPVTNVKAALGMLQQYAAERYSGLPLIHANKYAVELMPELLGTPDALTTRQGVPIANGGGYGEVGPGGIASPVLALGAAATVGGTFAAGTYYWTATALNAAGETISSNEVSAAVPLNGTQELTWGAVDGATGYRIWRGVASGEQTTLVATLGAVTSHTDTGAAGTAEAPPETNTTASTADAGEAWVYISGQVNVWSTVGEVIEGPALKANRNHHLVEATYVVTVECFAAAILIGN